MSDDKIADIKAGQDVLHVNDVLTGVSGVGSASDFFSGGYLNFEPVAQNTDGTVTIKLSIDSDGSASIPQSVALAEITINGLSLGNGVGDLATEILSQLHNEIKF